MRGRRGRHGEQEQGRGFPTLPRGGGRRRQSKQPPQARKRRQRQRRSHQQQGEEGDDDSEEEMDSQGRRRPTFSFDGEKVFEGEWQDTLSREGPPNAASAAGGASLPHIPLKLDRPRRLAQRTKTKYVGEDKVRTCWSRGEISDCLVGLPCLVSSED